MYPQGVVVKAINQNQDSRGHLVELFRIDELPVNFTPKMSYISYTHPGVSRGPHEHHTQSDLFVFIDGTYELKLWENRPNHGNAEITMIVGKDNPVSVIVPPGVVHGYKNIGDSDAYVLNFPNKLYAGWNKLSEVDEIRHEENDSPFKMDFSEDESWRCPKCGAKYSRVRLDCVCCEYSEEQTQEENTLTFWERIIGYWKK